MNITKNSNKPATQLQRKVINAFNLASKGRAVSAYKVLNELRKVMPNAQPPTVYRVLNMLLKENLIHKTDDNRFVRCQGIELGIEEGVSHNIFICNKCDSVNEVLWGLSVPYHLLLNSVMRGLCKHCRIKEGE